MSLEVDICGQIATKIADCGETVLPQKRKIERKRGRWRCGELGKIWTAQMKSQIVNLKVENFDRYMSCHI